MMLFVASTSKNSSYPAFQAPWVEDATGFLVTYIDCAGGIPGICLPLTLHTSNLNIFLLKRKRASKVFYSEYLFREEKFTQLVENYSAGN